MNAPSDGWLSVDAAIHALVEKYGAWAILCRMTQVLRPAFLALEEAERKAGRRPRKPPPEACRACDATGHEPDRPHGVCRYCHGTGYVESPTKAHCDICGDPNCSEPNQKH